MVDVACGEKIPAEILEALSDESVIKWAFNALSERVCLSNYLGEWLEPESWKCSMVWSVTLGLPLSLENVGEVFWLEDAEGELKRMEELENARKELGKVKREKPCRRKCSGQFN